MAVEPGAPADGAGFNADLFVRYPPFAVAVPGDPRVECTQLPVSPLRVFEDGTHGVLAPPPPMTFHPVVPDWPDLDAGRCAHGVPLAGAIRAQRHATPL